MNTLRPLAIIALTVGLTGVLTACPSEPSGEFTCPNDWYCFPENDIPADLLGNTGGDNGGEPDTPTVDIDQRDDGGGPGPDISSDTPTTDEGGGDGTTVDVVEDIPAPDPGEFGAPCNANVDCNSGWCVEGPEGYVCTKTCSEECPSSWDCKAVLSGGSDLVFLCVPQVNKVCVPCTNDIQCTGGKCLLIDGERQCGFQCSDSAECPQGYECNPDPEAPDSGTNYCQPVTGSCQCNQELDGSVRTCLRENALGTCYGVETCDGAVGWGNCSATEPTAEICDGIDNDCNALIDDGVAPPTDTCENTNEFGTCAGTFVCSDPDGQSGIQFWCTAGTPEEEVCDLLDNNCDGEVDEVFKTNGVYVDQQNCGACGISCDGAIPNANGTVCAENGGQPRCEVVECAPGYYLATPTTCLASNQTLCAPCETDANCEVPGDTCNDLDGAKFCGRDCSADNIYGFPEGECPPGFTCNDLGGDNFQCQPESLSCACLPGDDGNSRNCVNENTFGQCFGTQVCNSTLGWSDCTADVPAAEICDGIDNDCNGQQDDVTGRGDSCENSNDDGTCTGILDCVDGQGDALVCTAAVPAPEVCDYADNNCDGTVDEGFSLLYESCSVGVGICQRFGFYECAVDGSAEECNAVEATAEAEICNGLDDNCDGVTDEGFDDLGTICTAGSGSCQNTGITICNQTGSGTTCSVSGGDGSPEICDGIDNDCNGLSDETFPGTGEACIVGLGTCAQPGTVQCNAAQDGTECDAVALPAGVETCDGLDNDCDGTTDNNLVDEACALQVGVCANSVKSCGGLNGFLDCQSAEYGADYEPTELTCDGLDNDCDGETDNGLFAPSCALQNGVCAGTTQTCDGANGFIACTATEYGATYQAGDETGLCDGLDNDCDGEVDEEFPTKGTVCQAGQGACAQAGTFVCNAAGDGVECNAVAGTPQPETCDGIDNNCDGQVDNNVTGAPACPLTQGVCAGATQRCISGGFQACTAAEYGSDYEPTEFSCDGLDNDCDGLTDEDDSDVVAPPCSLQLGVCNGAQQTCGGAAGWQACGATEYGSDFQAGDEVDLCDDLDNDCDGQVDEDFATKGGVCNDGVGACAVSGTFVCNGTNDGVVCSVTAPSGDPETCNGVDDDCNGVVDDNVTSGAPACNLTQGVCAGSVQSCIGGGFQACTAAEYGATFQAGTEFSCDGLDNDCDGQTDEASDLTSPPCANQNGVCAGSVQVCGGATGFGACDAAVYGAYSSDYQAGDETGLCDNLDNDCDGLVDEDFGQKGLPCTAGTGACAVVGTNICNPGGTGVVCSATPGTAGTETCNGIDDDCDGNIDNFTTPDCPLQQGVCAGSTQVCAGASGLQACTAGNYGADFEPSEVSCDGLDNDCDGDTDADDADLPTQPCPNQEGVCAGSTQTCSGGAFQACGAADYGANYEATETTCDNLDNDCDGVTDEGFVNGGKYDQDTACGSCFTDCTQIFDLDNAFGTCDATGTPTCELNCDPGFFDLNGIVNDGCEFELRSDTIYVSATDGADSATCGLGPVGTGTGNQPCLTIDQGLDRAVALSGRDRVFVASGAYVEDVVIRNGIDLFGGYNPVTWERDIAANLTSIFGANPGSGHNKAVQAVSITATTVFDGFAVYGESASGSSNNSYAIYIQNSDSDLQISNNLIFAGNGSQGGLGSAGSDGLDGANGAAGSDCVESNTEDCNGTAFEGDGGSGGSRTCSGDVVSGGAGGTTQCPADCDATAGGSAGQPGTGGGTGGTAGTGSNNWESSNGACTTINTCGNPNEGGAGGDGGDGTDGSLGGGCSAGNSAGSVSGGEWTGVAGGNAGNGTPGGGGGGGGTGGGMDDNDGCGWDDKLGGAGGGGGSGACGGTGATGGGAGGGSFGIFFTANSGTTNVPTITGNTITLGVGGNGGNGGLGGAGGLGGDGAAGGAVDACDQAFALGPGGRGGQGGDGGNGGGGGGGCGGVSFGIYGHNINGAGPNWDSANVFSGTATGGQGGQGGASLGNSGTGGAQGASGDTSF